MSEAELKSLYDQLGRLRAGREGFSTAGYTAQQVASRQSWYDSRIKNVQTRIQALKLKQGKLPASATDQTKKAR